MKKRKKQQKRFREDLAVGMSKKLYVRSGSSSTTTFSNAAVVADVDSDDVSAVDMDIRVRKR